MDTCHALKVGDPGKYSMGTPLSKRVEFTRNYQPNCNECVFLIVLNLSQVESQVEDGGDGGPCACV
jgi:hypothetical protein